MLDWTEIVDECEYVPDVERGMNCHRRKVLWYGNRAASIWKEWRSYRRNTYCILLSGLFLNAIPVMEQAERHIISKKLRKGPDFAEQKMADWSGGEMRPLDHILPQRSLRAQLPLESLLQLQRFMWKPPQTIETEIPLAFIRSCFRFMNAYRLGRSAAWLCILGIASLLV